MIGFIQGDVLFSDGQESLIMTSSGIGYQIYFSEILLEGSQAGLYISHIVKEDSETLFGFLSLREKKIFELLLKVKGIGPKSAYTLLASLGSDEVCQAIALENKDQLKKAPGVGNKAAAQIILDLSQKITKLGMYSEKYNAENVEVQRDEKGLQKVGKIKTSKVENNNHGAILNEAIMACKELGFKEEKIFPMASKILNDKTINKAEQLVHLVLREL